MPTARPRHTLTETAEIAEALDAAALQWPALRDDRGALLRRLVEAGRATLRSGDIHALVASAAGSATGTYPRDARANLLNEWPE